VKSLSAVAVVARKGVGEGVGGSLRSLVVCSIVGGCTTH